MLFLLTLPRTALVLEQIRLLAVLRLADGWSQRDVADFLEVSVRSVRRWRHDFRRNGEAGLAPRSGRGRPCKLDRAQAEQVLSWLDRSACEFGFVTDRWTAPRLASVIEQRLGIRLNPRYLSAWLRRHGVTPQMPQRQPRERDDALIDAWVRYQWPRLKKRRKPCTGPLVLQMNPASCWRR
jgi:transposase